MDPYVGAAAGALLFGAVMIGALAAMPWLDRIAESVEQRLKRR